jgi:hypothetical protein
MGALSKSSSMAMSPWLVCRVIIFGPALLGGLVVGWKLLRKAMIRALPEDWNNRFIKAV